MAMCILSHDNQRFVIGWIEAVTAPAIRFVVISLPPVSFRCKRSMVRMVLHWYAWYYRWTHSSHRRRVSIDFRIPGRSREDNDRRGEETLFFVKTFLYLFLKLELEKENRKHTEVILFLSSRYRNKFHASIALVLLRTNLMIIFLLDLKSVKWILQ